LRYSLWGERVEKGLGQSYRIENGRFTTCQCAEGPPSWSISGEQLNVDLGGYGRLRGGTFNILDVPVAYIPRALFPVQRERQSGFLMPQFGVSNRRGFQTLVPVYWAIDKSQDATLALDVETSARAGVVGEYRYAVSRQSRGRLEASYFNESFRGLAPSKPFELSVPEQRWSIVGEHDQQFSDRTAAYVDAFLVSDDLFLREINTYAFEHTHDVAIRTLPYTESRAGVVHLWDHAALTADTTYYQDLTAHESSTLQRVPEITLWGQGRLTPWALGAFTGSAVDFQRARGADGIRLDLHPAAFVPLPLGPLAFGAVKASVRETAYHLTNDRVPLTGQQLPRDTSREIFELGAEVGTVLSRTYPVRWLALEKIKHTLEPAISYLYIPAVGQEDLPLFDGVDRISRRNLISYGLVSRFVGKFADTSGDHTGPASPPPVRELARLFLMQSVDVSREIDPLQTGRAADHFSDLDFGGRVNPSRSLSLRFDSNYDTGNTNFSAARVGLFVEDPRPAAQDRRLQTRTSAGVSYRVLTQNLLQEVDGNFALHVTDWAGLLYSTRYDVVARRFLDNFVGIRLISTCDCWGLDIAVTNRTNPQEVEVRAQLTLVGLGSNRPQTRTAAHP